jgi:serine/threonine-protein kinase RsbW
LSNQKKADEHADLPVPALVEHRSCDFLHDRMIIKINVTMPASPEAISSTVDRIMEKVRENECAAGKEFEIEIALREALANAIKHGCKGDPSKQVQCCIACEEGGGMLIIVRDPGQGFDPLAIPDCTMGENLYENHGRGIYLINELMDEVEFKRNGTEIHMRKY